MCIRDRFSGISPLDNTGLVNVPNTAFSHSKSCSGHISVSYTHLYTLVTLKGSNEDKISYYKALEESHTENKPAAFQKLVVEAEIASLQRYLSIMQ